MVIGRGAEHRRLGLLLAGARSGTASTVVMEGEAGIGKTALLADLESTADGFRILRAEGVQSESQLAYAGMLSLCRPVMDFLEDVPEGHAAALRAALGLAAGAGPPERLLVGAGLLGLLAAASAVEPLLVLLDDLHWLDVPSAQAVVFALRRLESEPVAAAITVRTGVTLPARLDGLDRMVLSGLDRESAGALVASVAPDTTREIVDRLQQATGGNPLALIEIAVSLTDAQRAGREVLADPLPGPGDLQAWYAGRVTTFAEETRRALLIAATTGDTALHLISRALTRVACTVDDLVPASDSGLLTVERAELRWRHPLVRSAVYYGAPIAERRTAHLAMAAVYAPEDPAWAWHQVAAAVGPDELVARALDQVSSDARARSAFSTAASASEHAARVSVSPHDVQRRMYSAADSAWLGGDPARAARLLDEALECPGDEQLRGRMLFLRGYSEYAGGRVGPAGDLLRRAAAALWATDPEAAARALGEAVLASWWAGDVSQMLVDAERLGELASEHPRVGPYARFAAGTALMFSGRGGDGASLIEGALAEQQAVRPEATDPRDIWVVAGLGWLGRTAEGRTAAAERLLDFRRRGLVGMLPRLLRMISSQDLDEDRWDDALSEATEGLEWCDELAQSGHRPELLAVLATVAAWRGKDEECARFVTQALNESEAHGHYWTSLIARRAQGLWRLGHAQYEEAVALFEPIVEIPLSRGLRGPTVASFPDLVEALTRVGRHDDAAQRAEQFERRLAGVTDPRARPLTLRCRALIDSDRRAGELFEQALEAHGTRHDPFVTARTRLLYGEWLRRGGSRRQARQHLTAALETFDSCGARPWASRTRDELRASGATLTAQPQPGTELTPAELRVAVLAAHGMPTRELCAQLYLSQKTVETHLGRIYRKLGVRNRAELARRFPPTEATRTFDRVEVSEQRL